MLSEHPSSAVSDRGSELLSGATVSSRMAQSRCGSAGELLAWRPDRVGHEALMGEPVGSHRTFGKGVQRARTMRILTRLAKRRLRGTR